MRYRIFAVTIAVVCAAALGVGTGAAFAQAKQGTGASNKRAACIAKSRAENPNDGNARNAAFRRCMGGG
jgi:hypothetical protein